MLNLHFIYFFHFPLCLQILCKFSGKLFYIRLLAKNPLEDPFKKRPLAAGGNIYFHYWFSLKYFSNRQFHSLINSL